MHKIFLVLFIALTCARSSFAKGCNPSPSQSEYDCMLCNCYYEAGGEDPAGQLEVGKVVMTRTRLPGYPNSVCKVIYAPGQFNWVTDKKPNLTVPQGHSCYKIAKQSLEFTGIGPDSFKNPKISSEKWPKCRFNKTIGNHAFYSCATSRKPVPGKSKSSSGAAAK